MKLKNFMQAAEGLMLYFWLINIAGGIFLMFRGQPCIIVYGIAGVVSGLLIHYNLDHTEDSIIS